MKKRIFEILRTMFVLLAVVTLWGLGSSCDDDGGPPPAVTGNFRTNVENYNCQTDDPLRIVKQNLNGGGIFVIDVTGDDPPFFKFSETYNQFSAGIDCPFGSGCCAFADFPETGSYVLTVFFNEFGDANCSPPPPAGLCYRWLKQTSYASGFLPDCTDFISVDEMNPNGFTGPCQ